MIPGHDPSDCHRCIIINEVVHKSLGEICHYQQNLLQHYYLLDNLVLEMVICPKLASQERNEAQTKCIIKQLLIGCHRRVRIPKHKLKQVLLKGAKNEIQNPLRRRNTRHKNPQLVAQHCFVASFCRCFPIFTLRDQLVARCGLKKVVPKSRARVYFEQQILALLLVFHQTHNLSRNKFACDLEINQSARRISSTRNKCFCCGSS